MVVISNVNNKYIAAKETVYGTTPGTFTSVDFGHIQKITISEEENMEKVASVNSGHLYALFEDGLYWANVSIDTLVSKASLPILLEACMGKKVETTDYTITTDPTNDDSYSIKVTYSTADIALINGFGIKDWEITAAKGDKVALTMNGIARKVSNVTEVIAPTTNTDELFKDLDASVTIGGNSFVLNSFSISSNWNVTDDEGRGIESVSAGDRRLITTIIRHRLDVSGSYEAEVSDSAEFGYTEERSDEAIIFTLNRGTDNEHTFTMTKTRSVSRSMDSTIENSKKVISYDYEAIDVGAVGDL